MGKAISVRDFKMYQYQLSRSILALIREFKEEGRFPNMDDAEIFRNVVSRPAYREITTELDEIGKNQATLHLLR